MRRYSRWICMINCMIWYSQLPARSRGCDEPSRGARGGGEIRRNQREERKYFESRPLLQGVARSVQLVDHWSDWHAPDIKRYISWLRWTLKRPLKSNEPIAVIVASLPVFSSLLRLTRRSGKSSCPEARSITGNGVEKHFSYKVQKRRTNLHQPRYYLSIEFVTSMHGY